MVRKGIGRRVSRVFRRVYYSLRTPLVILKGSKYTLNTVIGFLSILIVIFLRFRVKVVAFMTLSSRFI